MDYKAFRAALDQNQPATDMTDALKALWWDAKGDWENAHDIAQEIESETGYWIHAYLHRKEGDIFNARYWYRRANKTFPTVSFDEEHQGIARFLLS